jgi:hypothetical protein
MRRSLIVLAVALAVAPVRADITSGPKEGEKLEDFKVFGVVGPVEGKEVSYLQERKDDVTVYAFVQQEHWSRPMARFLKTLDAEIKKTDEKGRVVAVWLTEKPDEAKDYLPKAQASLQFGNTALTVFPGEKSGPNGWSINTDAHITVVVAAKGKAKAVFAFLSVNETDARQVAAAVKKTGGKE